MGSNHLTHAPQTNILIRILSRRQSYEILDNFPYGQGLVEFK